MTWKSQLESYGKMSQRKMSSGKRKMLQLLMIIAGAFALIKGEFNLTRNRRMTKTHGRITGIILLMTGFAGGLVALVGLIGAVVYGLVNTNPDDTIHRW
jgi:hypothetical protein